MKSKSSGCFELPAAVYGHCVDHPGAGGQPVFVPRQLDNVTVNAGRTATLLCRVYGDVSTRPQVCHSVGTTVIDDDHARASHSAGRL